MVEGALMYAPPSNLLFGRIKMIESIAIDIPRFPQMIVAQCVGCNRVKGEDIIECVPYYRPAYWWNHGRCCPLATHYIASVEKKENGKTRVGQQKQRKH
jgi:hypothetical protein